MHEDLGYRIYYFIISGLCTCLTAPLPLYRDTKSSEGVIANDTVPVCNCTYDSFNESPLI